MLNINMKNCITTGVLSLILSIGSPYPCVAQGGEALPPKAEIRHTLQNVTDRQMADFHYSAKGNAFHLHDYGIDAWTNATFFLGLAEWSSIAREPEPYREWLREKGEQMNWQLPRNFIHHPQYGMYHADELCIGQFYLAMYDCYQDKEMMEDTRQRLDAIIANPPKPDMSYLNKQAWTWCDALFMAPPVYARMAAITKESKYTDFMDQQFRNTCNHLYSPADSLFYRDGSYFDRTEQNGAKIFWGRGNGWVAAGLVNILKVLPRSSEHRSFYEALFAQLCTRLARLQSADGFWHASLLDSAAYPSPETSATSLITYALAYGVNHGLLERKTFYPTIVRAWSALTSAIDGDGRLGWVQPIGADPKTVTRDMTSVYGPGALLLAGTEVIRLDSPSDTDNQAASAPGGRIVLPFNKDWSFRQGPFEQNPILAAASPFSPDESITGGFSNQKWQTVDVPHTWNATDMQTDKNNFYAGEACYRKTYTPGISLKDRRIFLRFEGVASTASVYVNGTLAGKHEGGYSAFAIEISPLLNFGKPNEILVCADNASRPDVIPVNHNLFGVYGGIYRPVSLIITEKAHIAITDHASPGIYITQKQVSRKSADIHILTKLENKYNHTLDLRLITTIYETDGRVKSKLQNDIALSPQGRQAFEQPLTLQRPHLWQGLEDPYLYKVVTQLADRQGRIIDEVTQPLGVRHIELRQGDGLYLNGKHVPMYGVCRHQDRLGVGSALTNAHHDEDLSLIREIGATTIRLAHYQQAEYVYDKCDSIGFLVWAEIPFVNRVTTQEAGNACQQLVELIRQNYNHPSIYVWGLHNEVYIPHNYTAELTAELHDLAKSEDPGRYTVSVNGYGDAGHPVNMQADIHGINRYFGWYERKMQDLKPWLESLERNYPGHHIMLAEYGAEANIDQQNEVTGDAGDCCGFTRKYNETFATRLHEEQWGYIANCPYLAASYLWNMFDFCTPMSSQGGVEARNMKGMVTFDRKVRKDPFYWYKANWSKAPVVYITGRRNRNRYRADTSVTVYSNQGEPALYINGKKAGSPRQGTTSVHFIFENVKLALGENILEAKVQQKDSVIQDCIVWYYHPENETENQTILIKEKEHTGL